MLNDFKVSLKFSVLGLFLTLFVATILTIVLITSLRFYHSQILLSKQQMAIVSNDVQRELQSLLRPAEQSANLIVKLVERKTLNVKDGMQAADFSMQILKSIPNAAMVYWSDIKGNFIISRREPDGTFSSEIIDRNVNPPTDTIYYRDHADIIIKTTSVSKITYDPRTRPWYVAAEKAKDFTWSKPYIFFSGAVKSLGITAAAPAYRNDTLLGVVGIDMRLQSLTDFLSRQKIGKVGVAYIVDQSGNLIAHPALKNVHHTGNGLATLAGVDEIDSWPAKAYHQFNKTSFKKFSFYDNREKYLASFQSIKGFEDQKWFIAVVAPENDFVGELKHANIITIQICALILILGVALITFYSRQISKALVKLVNVTKKIEELQLEDTPAIKTHISEISFLAEAVYSMRSGLRSFQKYVPADLVRILIRKGMGDHIGGSRKNVTIFFTDIKNFTSIAEKMPPEDLMLHLCDYFDAISTIIRNNLGTIDKYIGDAVMAFWNNPVTDELHCYHACISALQFQIKLKSLNAQWRDEGKPELPTRIGIHTGDAIIGNLGSSTRINYTAIGDNINLASRLESINSIYGTEILVSQDVVNLVQDKFVFRLLDNITVKGKELQHQVYELVCEAGPNVDPAVLEYVEKYGEAFNAYELQKWDEAISLLNQLIAQRPDDKAATLLLGRCTIFKQTPPPKDWDGIWRYTTKGE